MSETDAWARLPEETDKSYHAFCMYRDMGAVRTFPALGRLLGLQEKTVGQLYDWSAKYSWRDRVKAYDEYLSEVRVQAEVDAVREMAERHIKIAGLMLDAVEESLTGEDGGRRQTPGSRDLHGWVKTAADLERITRGQPTEIGKSEVGVTEHHDPLEQAMRDRLQNDPVAQELALKLLEQVAGEVPAPEVPEEPNA